MLDDALLAWEMNGEPVPHAHGGPLRLIVPGYSGVNNVKYIKRLAFTRDQTDAAIQRTGYRMHPPGTKGDPSFPPVWEMGPKSWINSPAPEAGPVRSGWVQIQGVAMGGMQAPRRVDVSLDGGKTWREASFIGPNLGRYRLASIRSASANETGDILHCLARHGFAGQRSGRKHTGQCRWLSECRVARTRGSTSRCIRPFEVRSG